MRPTERIPILYRVRVRARARARVRARARARASPDPDLGVECGRGERGERIHQ